jgi:predicted anti-sigma-YlaC factor YlaD
MGVGSRFDSSEIRPRAGPGRGRTAPVLVLALAALAVVASGCSLRRLAVNTAAKALAASGDVYASDDDPELIRAATPFALKTIEGLLAESPRHEGLLLAACRGFTQYAYAFVETDAEVVAGSDYDQAERLRERALRLYLRARDYGLRGLDGAVAGTSQRLRSSPEGSLAAFGADRVALLYWTGAAWGGAIALGKDRPELVADLPAVKALMERALALDPGFEEGAIHEAMIVFESLGAAFGGSPERAREHFEQAVALAGGGKASPYVTYAEDVAVKAQDRGQFRELLAKALAVDPDARPNLRLANLIAQRRARALLARTDELFLDDDAPSDDAPSDDAPSDETSSEKTPPEETP